MNDLRGSWGQEECSPAGCTHGISLYSGAAAPTCCTTARRRRRRAVARPGCTQTQRRCLRTGESGPSQSPGRLVNDGGSFPHGHTRSRRRVESTPAIVPFFRFIGYCSDIKVPSLPLRLTIACVIGTMWPQVLGHKGANGTGLPTYSVCSTLISGSKHTLD